MAVIAYENVSNELQSQIISILKNNSSNTHSFTTNVLDGSPKSLWQGRGFPYVLVHTPMISEENITMSKKLMKATVEIEIISEQEGIVRQVYDAVRTDLNNNKTIKQNHAYHYRNTTSDLSYTMVNVGGRLKGYWTITAKVEYTVMS